MNTLRTSIVCALAGAALTAVSGYAGATARPTGENISGVVLTQGTAVDTTSIIYDGNGDNISSFNGTPGLAWNGSNNNNLGWGHNTDWYSFQSTTTGLLEISVKADSINPGFSPAFSVWSATGLNDWETDGGDGSSYYQDRANYIDGVLAPLVGFANSGVTTVLNQGPVDTGLVLNGPGNTGKAGDAGEAGAYVNVGAGYAELFFNTTAGQYYTIGVGGSGSVAGYYTIEANAAVSAVPVPAAVWLFGSALLGFVGLGRKKAI